MNIQSGLSLRDNLFVNGLLMPEVQQKIQNRAFGFNSVTTMIDKGSSAAIEVNSFKYDIPFIGNLAISCTVPSAPTAGSGGTILVPIPSGDTRWRVKDKVYDTKNRIQAKVVAVNGNVLTLESMATTLNASTMFQAGTNMANIGTISGNDTTTGLTNISTVYDQDYGVLAKRRDTSDLGVRDRSKTFLKYAGQYWYGSNQMFLLQRVNQVRELDYVLSDRLLEQTSNVEGTYNQMGGIRWTSKTANSTYQLLNSAPQIGDIENMIYQFRSKKAQSGQTVREVDLYCGAQIIKLIQDYLKATIQYAGVNSVYEMKTDSGQNVWILPLGGLKCRVHQYSLFDNRGMFGEQITSTGFTEMESTCFLMDWNGVEDMNGGGHIPTIQKYKFAGLPLEQMKVLKGMDVFNEYGTAVNMGQAESAIDVVTWEYYNLQGIYVVPENVAWMEASL